MKQQSTNFTTFLSVLAGAILCAVGGACYAADSAPAQPVALSSDAPATKDKNGYLVIPYTGPRGARAADVAAASAPASTLASSSAATPLVQEAWFNGVSVDEWAREAVITRIFRPAFAFLSVPSQWVLQTPTRTVAAAQEAPAQLASLAPAAGQVAVPVVATNELVVPPAQSVDPQPMPAISGQSQSMIHNIPPTVSDRVAEKTLPRDVKIERGTPSAAVIPASEPPSNAQALGIKPGGAKSSLNVNYELERAYNALLAGQSETAMRIYEDILTGNPRNKDALFGLASSYHRVGQLPMARSLYAKLLEVDPKHRDGLNNFLVLLAEESPRDALLHMEQLEAQNPDFSPIPAQMAIIYQKLGDRQKAVEKMYRALSIAPDNMTYVYNLAIMLDKSGDYPQASQLYTRLLAAKNKGEPIPGDATKIQQRLTFIRSNSVR